MSLTRRALYHVGMWVRETGQALDRAGCRLQGNYGFEEKLSRHRQVMNLMDRKPVIGKDVFIAPNASVIGEVTLHDGSSVWYGAVIRADAAGISVGAGTNIQDRALVYVTDQGVGSRGPGEKEAVRSASIGADVTVGHGAIVQAALIENEVVVGMGAVIKEGAAIRKNAVIAPGSVVERGTEVGSGELWAGSPAALVRKLDAGEMDNIKKSAQGYAQLARAHAEECGKTHEQIQAELIRRELLEERSPDYNSHLGLLGREKEIVEIQARIIEEDRKAQTQAGSS